MSEEIFTVIICQEMGWDFWQYESQPEWFLDLLKIKLNLDAEKQNRDARRANKKYGR